MFIYVKQIDDIAVYVRVIVCSWDMNLTNTGLL